MYIYVYVHIYSTTAATWMSQVVHSYKCGKGLTVGTQLVGFQCQTEPCNMRGYRSGVIQMRT